MYVTNEKYQEMCQNVEFCKVHSDTELVVEDGCWSVGTNEIGEEIEIGYAQKLCPKCEKENQTIPTIKREFTEKDDMWYND
jgi:hypothetical protein